MTWRPRYSLRTLVVFLLLVTSGMGLWWHWEPWVRTAAFRRKSPVIRMGFSDEGALKTVEGKPHMVLGPPEIKIGGGAAGERCLLVSDDGELWVICEPGGRPAVMLAMLDFDLWEVIAVAMSRDESLVAISTLAGEVRAYRRRRPEWWWGVFYLWEFWLTAAFGVMLLWSIWRDGRVLRSAD